jgi:multiple sugar transport system permease protein
LSSGSSSSRRFFAGLGPTLSERAWGYVLIGPALALLFVFAVAPILDSIWLSLHRRLPIFNVDEFIGFRNYVLIAGDERFWAACGTTLYFTAVSVAAELVLGLAMALVMDGAWSQAEAQAGPSAPGRRQSWNRVLILVPWAIPTVVSARMWEWLYHPEYGLFNFVMRSSGLVRDSINWLGSPVWAIHAAILMDVWKATPFAALLLLAGLQTIPRELYLAARVDGAGWWATFRHVTLPLLMPVILIVLAFRTMDAFRVFDAIYVLTGGGPGNSTETLSIYAYKTLFQSLRFGYGSAITSMMFLLVLGITAAYLLLMRRQIEKVAS